MNRRPLTIEDAQTNFCIFDSSLSVIDKMPSPLPVVSNRTSIYLCKRHGAISKNLCERCVARLAGYSPIVDPGAAYLYCLYLLATKFAKPALKVAEVVLNILLRILKFLFYIGSTFFVCLIMSWVVRPSPSPEEKEKRDREYQERKARDAAWFARRDQEDERRRQEQLDWESERDADWRKAQEEQIAWEDKREREYRKAMNEYIEAEKKKTAEKVALGSSDPKNDLKYLNQLNEKSKELPETDTSEMNDNYVNGLLDDKKEENEKHAQDLFGEAQDEFFRGSNSKEASSEWKAEDKFKEAEEKEEDSEELGRNRMY